jgi:hypothetical protein
MTRTLINNFAVELHSLRDFASNPKKKGDLPTSEFYQLEQIDHLFLKFDNTIFKKSDEEKKKLRKLKAELGIPLTKD